MSLVNQNGARVMTTRGPRFKPTRLCYSCDQEKPDGLFGLDSNNRPICPDCAGRKGAGVLRQVCEDPENCACQKVQLDEPDPDSE